MCPLSEKQQVARADWNAACVYLSQGHLTTHSAPYVSLLVSITAPGGQDWQVLDLYHRHSLRLRAGVSSAMCGL